MRQEITLSRPLTIKGKVVKTLTYDTDEITAIAFTEAESRKLKTIGSRGGNLSGAVELDYGLHLYLGFAAILAVNPQIDYTDLERMKGSDVMEVMKIGRDFINPKPVEALPEDVGNTMSGNVPVHTISQPVMSNESA